MVDPKKNTLWRALRNHIKTDDVHLNDQLNFQSEAKGERRCSSRSVYARLAPQRRSPKR